MLRRTPLWLSVLLCACQSSATSDDRSLLLIQGGRIYLGAPDWNAVEAILVRDGRVAAVGDLAACRRAAGEREPAVHDLGGAVALPGLVDGHGHIEGLGELLDSVDLRSATSFDQVVQACREAARALPEGAWLVGRGWDHTRWGSSEFPTHGRLSEALPDRPVVLERVDGHAVLVNRRVLQLADLDRDVRQVAIAGGQILCDEAGHPTGILVDQAMGLVLRHKPPPSRAERRSRILRAQQALLAAGLTGVHDMGIDPEGLELFLELDRSGELELNVVGYAWGNDELQLEVLKELCERALAGDRLRLRGVKLMADGALGSRGAWLLSDYSDAPGQVGTPILTEAELARRVGLCADAGLQPAVHAIGDRANRAVLDAFAALGERLRPLRPRVEHAQVVAREDWPRFEALGAIPSVQPTHATSDMRWAGERLGPERLLGAYAWRRIRGERAPLALGSDFPVESERPLLGLYAAITRQDAAGDPPGGFMPDQRLSAREALTGFTQGCAFAAGQEDERGRLAPGCFADLTVLSADPLRCDPRELLEIEVLATLVDGRVVFSKAAR